jgi:hypothetical protein
LLAGKRPQEGNYLGGCSWPFVRETTAHRVHDGSQPFRRAGQGLGQRTRRD